VSLQNASPTEMNPADITQLQAIIAHQGEMLATYQEQLATAAKIAAEATGSTNAYASSSFMRELHIDSIPSASGVSLQNASPTEMNPADITQLQAIIAHQGEMLATYQEQLATAAKIAAEATGSTNAYASSSFMRLTWPCLTTPVESPDPHPQKVIAQIWLMFFRRRVLNLTSSVYELGSVRWELTLCLLLSWIICYFCLWKGVKSTGKVVFFTATFSYVMLVVLLVRGLTLPGAIDGIKFYLYPDPAQLKDPQMILQFTIEVMHFKYHSLLICVDGCWNADFHVYSLCTGSLTFLGSYNMYNNNRYKDCIYLCLLNSGTSFVAGFAIFSVLGFMAYEQETHISTVAESGPGLVFIAYTNAIAMMPVPHLSAICFFLMIILIGMDTIFVFLEALTTAVTDMYPSFFLFGNCRKGFLLIICVGCFLCGLVMVTEGGLYIFHLFDYYSYSGMTLLLFAILQSVSIGWVYDANRLYYNIEDMIGYRPLFLIKYCWKYITPLVCTGAFVFSLVKFTPLKFNNIIEYPWWGYAIGWYFTLSSTLSVPL
ncbi:hypothetical protein QTP86_030519, partial [Hemibagrus guttatus]